MGSSEAATVVSGVTFGDSEEVRFEGSEEG